MMREELEAALHQFEKRVAYDPSLGGYVALVSAARKQLALMPEKCGTCGGSGEFRSAGYADATRFAGWYPCGDCVEGKVYPPETVEKIAEAIDSISDEVWGYRGRQAVAVLDALREP